jgi:hypothetical protein
MTQKVVSNDKAVTGPNNFFAIISNFERYVTKNEGYFWGNCKKFKIHPQQWVVALLSLPHF